MMRDIIKQMYLLLLLVLIILAIILLNSQRNRQDKVSHKTQYHYIKQHKIMSNAEGRLFRSLSSIVGEQFIIIPQAHLSSFIDHKVKGQNWKAAFSTINGKSVDFLLAAKDTLEPRVTVELDDWSHKREDRVERDDRVKQILDEAGIPLVRFDNPDIDQQTIINILSPFIYGQDLETRK